jgi:hypothetical protein
MRLWPFPSATAPEANRAPAEGYAVVEDLLRRNIGILHRRQEVRGRGWGGHWWTARPRS